MNYLATSLRYKVNKVIRYIELYGLRKTIHKIKGQYHLKNDGKSLEKRWESNRSDRKNGFIGIIGCGNFAYTQIAFYCSSLKKNSIRAAFDPIGNRSISLIKNWGGDYAATSPKEIFNDPKIRNVFVASNHASHAEYAIEALLKDKIVHIEKPHVISHEQLNKLIKTYYKLENPKIYLGFNRPKSYLFKTLQKHIRNETGPISINWFIAGHAIDPDHWYFRDSEGGRILGNLCHWTDLSLRMVGLENAFPITIKTLNPQKSDSNFSISILFGDTSLASISFSCKGHTFEGVREYLNLHKGDLLASLRDFKDLRIDKGEKRIFKKHVFRNHGHKAAIESSLKDSEPESFRMIIETARLFLAVKDSVNSGDSIKIEEYPLKN